MSLLDGSSPATVELRSRLRHIAPHFRALLVSGDSGTGKQQVARELHRLVAPHGPFLAHWSARHRLPRSTRQLPGSSVHTTFETLLRSARGGLLFVHEIGEMPLTEQALLFRALNSPALNAAPRMERARVVASTCHNPNFLLTTGRLHREIHQLLCAMEIRVSPLSERQGDIEDLAKCFVAERNPLSRFSEPPQLSEECLSRLRSRPWHGNVGELRVVVQQLHAENEHPSAAPDELVCSRSPEPHVEAKASSVRLQDFLQAHVRKVLCLCHGNKLKAADLLGVSRSTLYRMLDGKSEPIA